VVVLLGTVLFAVLRYAGGRTPLGIGVLVVVEIAAILMALAFSVRRSPRADRKRRGCAEDSEEDEMVAEPPVAVHLRALDPFDFLERAAFVYPDKTAVVDGAARRTYPAFLERVRRLAAALQAMACARATASPCWRRTPR